MSLSTQSRARRGSTLGFLLCVSAVLLVGTPNIARATDSAEAVATGVRKSASAGSDKSTATTKAKSRRRLEMDDSGGPRIPKPPKPQN